MHAEIEIDQDQSSLSEVELSTREALVDVQARPRRNLRSPRRPTNELYTEVICLDSSTIDYNWFKPMFQTWLSEPR